MRDLPSLSQPRCDRTRRSSREAPGCVSGKLQPLSRLPASPPALRAFRPESARRAREPVALPAPSGELGGAQKPRRALPVPNPLPGPSLAGPGSTAGLASPLYEPAEHWFGQDPLEPDETAQVAPHLPRSERGDWARLTSRPPGEPRARSHLITLATRAGRGEAGGSVTARAPPPAARPGGATRSAPERLAETRGPALAVRLRPPRSGLQVGMDKWAWIPETPKDSHLRLDRCSETPDVTPSPSGQVPGVRACVLAEPVRDSVQGVLQASLVGCFSF